MEKNTFSVSTRKYRARYVYLVLLAWDFLLLSFGQESLLLTLLAVLLMILMSVLLWYKSEYKIKVEEDGLLFVEEGRKRKLPWQCIREIDFPDYSNIQKMGSTQKISPRQMFVRIDKTALLGDVVEDGNPPKWSVLREDGWVNLSFFSSFSRDDFKSAVEANTSKRGLFPEQPYTKMPELNVYKLGSDEKNEIKIVVAAVFFFLSFVFFLVGVSFGKMYILYFFGIMFPAMGYMVLNLRYAFRRYALTLSPESIRITYDAGTVSVDANWDNVVSVARSSSFRGKGGYEGYFLYVKVKRLVKVNKTESIEKEEEDKFNASQFAESYDNSLYFCLDWPEFVALVDYFSRRDLVEVATRHLPLWGF
ncbi:MAG: hypothetical protein J5554_12585 [Paludibacteraceae bacterium]|nr:hypothetical protein [Paludibacteraceae bacterium]